MHVCHYTVKDDIGNHKGAPQIVTEVSVNLTVHGECVYLEISIKICIMQLMMFLLKNQDVLLGGRECQLAAGR